LPPSYHHGDPQSGTPAAASRRSNRNTTTPKSERGRGRKGHSIQPQVAQISSHLERTDRQGGSQMLDHQKGPKTENESSVLEQHGAATAKSERRRINQETRAATEYGSRQENWNESWDTCFSCETRLDGWMNCQGLLCLFAAQENLKKRFARKGTAQPTEEEAVTGKE